MRLTLRKRKPQRSIGIMLILSQKKAFEKNRYKANAETLRATQQKRYKLHSTSILFNRRRVYYAFASHRCASKLVHDAVHSESKKTRVQHARYLLKEPKCDVQELYVKNIKNLQPCSRTIHYG